MKKLVIIFVCLGVASFFLLKRAKQSGTFTQSSDVTNLQTHEAPTGQMFKSPIPISLENAKTYLKPEVTSALPPSLREFVILETKTLKSNQEKSEREKILGSRNIYLEVEAILGETTLAPVERHLAATAFINKALFSGTQDSQTQALATIERMIFNDNIKPNQPAALQQLLAEDKAELIHMYLTFNPKASADVVAKTKNFYKTPRIVQNTLKYHKELTTAARVLSSK